MKRGFTGWLLILFVWSAAGESLGAQQPSDPRLAEAQTEFDAASTLQEAGQYADALTRAEHALALRESVLGGSAPEVAECLNQVGELFRLQGNLSRATVPFQRALAIREAVLGDSHPQVADSLNRLALIYSTQASYARAEPLFRRALAIREAALGDAHPQVASSLNNLALLYFKQERYNRAEPLFLSALAIREALFGPTHPKVADSLSNLALLYAAQGLYGQAESLDRRALALREAALGPTHPDVADSLNDLAAIHWDQGGYAQAEPLYQRALAIREAAQGPTHPYVADSLNNLALLYTQWALYDRAEPLHLRALAIREESFGPTHPKVADSLDSLASLYSDQGLYNRAEPLYRRALALREAHFGGTHSHVADSLNNLARLYARQEMYARAEPLYRRAVAAQEASLGPTHHRVAASLGNLARMYIDQRRTAAALPLLTRAFFISEQRLRREALDFSAPRLSSFLRHMRDLEETVHEFLRTAPAEARVRCLALSTVLLIKGRSVGEMASISRTLHQSQGVDDPGTLGRLQGLRDQLATLSLTEAGSLASDEYQKQREALTKEEETLEAELAKRSAPSRALTNVPGPEQIVGRVAASLSKGSALVEFIVAQDRAPGPPSGTPEAKPVKPPRYLALVLFPDATTRAVDLGPAAPIDEAASSLRAALARHDEAIEEPAQRLHRLVFQPLRPLLGTTRRLFVSPDGQLGLVPFAALHDGHDFLLDSFDIIYLTSGRELLPRPASDAPASSVFVLADPNFSAQPTDLVPIPLAISGTSERRSVFRSVPDRGPWRQLPAARLEAQEIQRLLPQAHLFLGEDATKERLLSLPTPGLLHLATHGFFLGDAPTPPDTRARDLVETSNGPPPPQPEPLLNSGLVLAATPATGAKGTLVTALELAGLNLWGTQLVVLSACDTGRGEVQLGQGIQGLRRALIVAGAETVVSSLWSVDDDSTRLLMDGYYQNLLAGQGRASDLRDAMRSLRETHPHPSDWAPFIALGRDAPLQGIVPAAKP